MQEIPAGDNIKICNYIGEGGPLNWSVSVFCRSILFSQLKYRKGNSRTSAVNVTGLLLRNGDNIKSQISQLSSVCDDSW